MYRLLFQHVKCMSVALLWWNAALSQTAFIDSLKAKVVLQKEDTNKVKMLIAISGATAFSYPDTAFKAGREALALAEKIHYHSGIFEALFSINAALVTLGNYPLLLDHCYKMMAVAKESNNPREIAIANGLLAECYLNMGDYTTSLQYDYAVIKLMEKHFPETIYFMHLQMSKAFAGLHKNDTALMYARMVMAEINDSASVNDKSLLAPGLGNAYAVNGRYDSALYFFRSGLGISASNNFGTDLADDYNGMAGVFGALHQNDSAIYYAKKVLNTSMIKSYPLSLLKAAGMLASFYETAQQPDSELHYLKLADALKDSLFNKEKTKSIQLLSYQQQEKDKAIAAERLKVADRYLLYIIGIALAAMVVIAGILARNRRLKQMHGMRNRIADDLHDEIGSTLTNINVLSVLGRQHVAPESAVNTFFSRITDEVSLSSQALDDIIWMINMQNDAPEKMMFRMRRYAAELFDAGGIIYEVRFDENLNGIKLTMHLRRDLYLVFKEAVNNIYKHAAATAVSILLARKNKDIVLTIHDNGHGFDQSAANGHGLPSMQARAKKNAGSLAIETAATGTTITAQFPCI